MDLDWLAIVSRWLHILAAITAVGGTIFMRFALIPSVASLGEADRQQLLDAIRARWSKFVMMAIGFLLLSGFYNFYILAIRGPMVPQRMSTPLLNYHMLFGIKTMLAMAIFYLASVLVGRSALAQKFRQNARFWLNLNVALAVVLVCISGVLKNIPRVEKASRAPQAQAVETEPSS